MFFQWRMNTLSYYVTWRCMAKYSPMFINVLQNLWKCVHLYIHHLQLNLNSNVALVEKWKDNHWLPVKNVFNTEVMESFWWQWVPCKKWQSAKALMLLQDRLSVAREVECCLFDTYLVCLLSTNSTERGKSMAQPHDRPCLHCWVPMSVCCTVATMESSTLTWATLL